ncbi:MAG: hypothetical protein JSR17_08755 [Proteobacteria bacterium]|nr:hypothetical protein [Pseudomonadota bacterium]
MKRLQKLVFLCSISFLVCANAKEAKSISETLQEQKETTHELKQEIQKKRQEALAQQDKSALIMWDNIEAVLEAKSGCFKKKEELEMHLCIYESIKKLAESGNFAAQDTVAKTYMAKPQENYPMALHWFKIALENPNTPNEYKEYILEDVKKVEGLVKENKLVNEKPLSESLQEDMAYIDHEQQNLAKEIKKAALSKDLDSLKMLKELESVFSAQKPCFELKEEYDIQVCMLKQIKSLADKGNFFAQHQLGNIYENSIENKAMAIKWYNTAIKNPKTPKSYIPQIESDLQRVKSKTS